jgi:hypothetical protein
MAMGLGPIRSAQDTTSAGLHRPPAFRGNRVSRSVAWPAPMRRGTTAVPATDQPMPCSLELEPDIDAAVLRAGAASVLGRGEKAIVTAGRRVRMIVPVLRGRIGPVVVMMFLNILIVVIFRMILRESGQWGHGRQRKRRQGENDRFPSELMHGHCPLVARSRNYEPGPSDRKSRHRKSPVGNDLRRVLPTF